MKTNTNTTTNKNLTLPMTKFAKESWADLLSNGFKSVPDEQLTNLIQIIGCDSAFEYRYSVGNEDSEDNGELCTVVNMPYTIYDGVIQLKVAENLQLVNIDSENVIIFSFPIKEIGDFIYRVEEDSIEIYFRYRNLTIYLELRGLDIEDD